MIDKHTTTSQQHNYIIQINFNDTATAQRMDGRLRLSKRFQPFYPLKDFLLFKLERRMQTQRRKYLPKVDQTLRVNL